MQGEINEAGNLRIERRGQWHTQYCPFFRESLETPTPCGDWCPHFSEPERVDRLVFVWICQNKQLVFRSFTDERAIKKQEADHE